MKKFLLFLMISCGISSVYANSWWGPITNTSGDEWYIMANGSRGNVWGYEGEDWRNGRYNIIRNNDLFPVSSDRAGRAVGGLKFTTTQDINNSCVCIGSPQGSNIYRDCFQFSHSQFNSAMVASDASYNLAARDHIGLRAGSTPGFDIGPNSTVVRDANVCD